MAGTTSPRSTRSPHREAGFGRPTSDPRPTALSDLWVRDGLRGEPRRVTAFNDEALADVELREPQERHVTVDGRDIQGWFIPGADRPRRTASPSVGPSRS